MGGFTDKVVLVTGAGRGIGRAIALAFAREGAHVAANDLTPVNLDQTVASADGRATAFLADVAMRAPVQAMVEQIREAFGRIDILVNNAGVEPHGSLLTLDEWDWARAMAVNRDRALLADAVGRKADGGAGRRVDRQHRFDRRPRPRVGRSRRVRGEQVRAHRAHARGGPRVGDV